MERGGLKSLLESGVNPHLVQIIVDPGLLLCAQNTSRCFQELTDFNEGFGYRGSPSKRVFPFSQ